MNENLPNIVVRSLRDEVEIAVEKTILSMFLVHVATKGLSIGSLFLLYINDLSGVISDPMT